MYKMAGVVIVFYAVKRLVGHVFNGKAMKIEKGRRDLDMTSIAIDMTIHVRNLLPDSMKTSKTSLPPISFLSSVRLYTSLQMMHLTVKASG